MGTTAGASPRGPLIALGHDFYHLRFIEDAAGLRGNLDSIRPYLGEPISSKVPLAHTVEATHANATDVCVAHAPVRPDDAFVYAYSGYAGVEGRPEVAGVEWVVARRPSSVRGLSCALSAERGIKSRKDLGLIA